MLRVLASDLLKIRKKMIWFLVFLGPIGIIALQAVNYGLRYDYLMNQHQTNLWGGLLGNIVYLTIPVMLMGITILASMIANIEHQTNAWKQTIALPMSRFAIFGSKFLLTALLMLVSCTVLCMGTFIFGAALGLPLDQLPLGRLLSLMYLPYLASMTFIALQVWLSIAFKNQSIPLTAGIVSMMLILFGANYPDWMPWKWPYLSNQWNEPLYSAAAGVALGVLLLLAALVNLVRKDVS